MGLFRRLRARTWFRRANEPPSFTDPLATPDFFPMSIDTQGNTLRFVSVSRDTLRQSPCLDAQYTVFTSNVTLLADIPKLLTRKPRCSLQFIFHGAFCGSTLLARYLDRLPHCLVLKEPEILGHVSALKGKTARNDPELWHDWFKAVYAMLARPYPSDQAVVIKASSTCNWLGHSLLDHDERAKIAFLSSSLRTFLLQVLKSDERRHWLRQHMDFLCRPMLEVPFLKEISAVGLTDGQRAAAMWLVNSSLCESLLARSDSHRVLALNGEDLIAQPARTVVVVADFLGLLNDDADRRVLDGLQSLSFHAKDQNTPYDATRRARALDDAERQFGPEVNAAISWADAVSAGWLRQSPFPVG